MKNSKIDFISSLLSQKNISADDKKRLFLLANDELKKMDNSNDEIIKRLNEVEENIVKRLDVLQKDFFQESNKQENKNKQNLPAPKAVADFMSLFNQRDGLKYLTHDIDEGDFEIEKFLEKAKEIFHINTKINFTIPNNLWQIINQFAFEKSPQWSSYDSNYKEIKIKEGFSTDKWINWSKEQKYHPDRNQDFREIINCFRRLTRVKKPQLEILKDNVIENVFREHKKKYDIKAIDLEKADFYTHVPSFREALISIFEEIRDRADKDNKRKIRIKFDRNNEGDYFIRKLIITHFNSFPNGELNLLRKEWQEKGIMGKINEKIKGYCYWSVETKIEGKAKRINILRDTNTSEIEEIDEADALGFTHILTFYYK